MVLSTRTARHVGLILPVLYVFGVHTYGLLNTILVGTRMVYIVGDVII